MARDMSIPRPTLARLRSAVALAPLLALPLALLVTFLVYFPSLNDFFVFHDFIHIQGIRSTGVGECVQRVLDPSDGGESLFNTGKLYRPVYYLALLADYKAFGLDPLGYHLVNLFLHLLNVVLIWLIATRLTRSAAAAAVAALVYGIHPAYVDAPAWISAITEVLLATFSLGAIYLFMRSLEARGAAAGLLYLGSFVSAILALGSREPGAAVFLILPAYYFLAFRPADWRQWRAWLRFAPFFAVLAVWALVRLGVTRDVASGEGTPGVGKLGWHMFINMFKFNGWAVVPVFSQVGTWVPVATGVAAIAVLRFSEQLLRKGSGVARFVVAWWYLAILPYSTQATWLLAGRYMYVGMAAFAVACGMFVAWLAEASWVGSLPRLPQWPWPTIARAMAAGAVAIAAVILVVGAVHREDTFSRGSEEAHALLDQLQAQYPTLPAGSTLHVVDPPASTIFLDTPLFLEPEVRLYYPGLAKVDFLSQDQLPKLRESLGENEFVFIYEP